VTVRAQVVVLAALATFAIYAQDRPPAAKPAPTIVQVRLMVGSRAFETSGPGECTHTDDGSIYAVPAAIWSVQQSAETGRLTVTLFRPKRGGEMFTLVVWIGDRTHKASTVKTVDGGTVTGSGTVRFAATSAGGTFAVDATADTGARIIGTIACSAFKIPEENG
jgi:hypothetical protein